MENQKSSARIKSFWKNPGWVLLILFLAFFPILFTSDYHRHMAIMILLFITLAEAWNLIGGYAGQLSLGHALFFGVGAYTSTLLYLKAGISPWVGLLVGIVLSGMLSAIIGIASLRLKGPYFALVTLAFAEVLLIITHLWEGLTNGALGLSIPAVGNSLIDFQFVEKRPYYFIILVMMVAVILLSRRIESSRLGHYLIAIREEDTAASCLGIDVFRCKLKALMISACITSMAGSFYAQYMRFIHPSSVLGWEVSVQIIMIAIIGGSGTVPGPVLGGFILIPLSEISRATLGGGRFVGLHSMIYGLALIIVVMFLPGGVIKHFSRFSGVLKKKFMRKGA